MVDVQILVWKQVGEGKLSVPRNAEIFAHAKRRGIQIECLLRYPVALCQGVWLGDLTLWNKPDVASVA